MLKYLKSMAKAWCKDGIRTGSTALREALVAFHSWLSRRNIFLACQACYPSKNPLCFITDWGKLCHIRHIWYGCCRISSCSSLASARHSWLAFALERRLCSIDLLPEQALYSLKADGVLVIPWGGIEGFSALRWLSYSLSRFKRCDSWFFYQKLYACCKCNSRISKTSLAHFLL